MRGSLREPSVCAANPSAKRVCSCCRCSPLPQGERAHQRAPRIKNVRERTTAMPINYDQLMALMDKSKLGWNSSAAYLIPAIARGGSIELFDKVSRGSCIQVSMKKVFYREVIRFNKHELFLEFVLQLKPEIDETVLKTLKGMCWTCCLLSCRRK